MFQVGDRVKAVKGKQWANKQLEDLGDTITSIKEGKDLYHTYLRFGGQDSGMRATCFELLFPVSLENE
ncbi:hypothetical protein [Citrobacter phage CVT22]|uniref:Uncharacterized protein n=1 Tax=Citrobacter phage CVT22 TaxID=1622234 RepID=A0A0R6CRH0_9CAUD|nr:hypothetical protein APL39_gp60 [Citrobacter phage CVT22]AJT60764.1 hypothetical protein [Citrobacter phage CVT22]